MKNIYTVFFSILKNLLNSEAVKNNLYQENFLIHQRMNVLFYAGIYYYTMQISFFYLTFLYYHGLLSNIRNINIKK